MGIEPASLVIRAKNAHLEPDRRLYELEDVVKFLESKGFQEISNDGFFITYENSEYKDENKNTLFTIGDKENLFTMKHTIRHQ